MSEYIEREKLSLSLKEWQNTLIETYGKNDEYVRCIESVLIGIESAPAADVRPVVRATNKSESGFLCSACSFGDFGGFHGYKPNYCPNCGADMREES